MSFLKAMKRMFRFAIHENYFVTRKEYNEYGKWVSTQLTSLRFGETCSAIYPSKKGYKIVTNKKMYYAKHIIIGTGTIPSIPENIKNTNHQFIFHSSDYLFRKEEVLKRPSVTVIGSGQSAAEIFYDLLQHRYKFSKGLEWFTRSERFFPM
jgi:lysine N6-hydroxylase